MSETAQTVLPQLENSLAEVVGDDLAQTLVRVASSGAEWGLEEQLLINDGLEDMTPEKRDAALRILKQFETSL